MHMKLYHRGLGHSKSAPLILHACPTTQISMVTSVGHPMRGGGGAGGRGVCVADGRVLWTLIGVRMVQCEFVQIHTHLGDSNLISYTRTLSFAATS